MSHIKEGTLANQKTSKKKKVGFDHLFGVNLLKKFIDTKKKIMTDKVLDFSIEWLSKIGHYGLIFAAFLGFLFSLIVAIRLNSFFAFLYGLAWIVIVFVVQYTAHRFSKAGDTLIKNNPSSLASKAFLDCLGFLTMIAGVIILIAAILWTIRGAGVRQLFVGIGLFIMFEFFVIIAFNPKTINMEIVKTSTAGQEALGIIVFFLKGLLRLVPIFFGVGILVGIVLLFIDFIGVFGNSFRVTSAWEHAPSSAMIILVATLLPFVSFILFVLYYLAIDIIRAILSIPGKLDELKKK